MAEPSTTAHAWAPRPVLLVVAAIAGVALAVLAVLSADAAGRLLLGLAAAGLLGVAAVGAWARPRLAVDAAGLSVRGMGGRRRIAWPDVAQWEVVTHHRLGRRVPVLELTVRRDGREQLLLFSTLDLGADPVDVLDALRRARPA